MSEIGSTGQRRSSADFGGWAGVVIEIAPNRYAVYEMTRAQGTVTIEREMGSPSVISIEVSGAAVMHQTGDRPGRWSAERLAVES